MTGTARPQILLGAAAVASMALVAAFGFLAPDATGTVALGTMAQAVDELVALALCALVSLRTRGRARAVWSLFAAALGCWVVADSISFGFTVAGAEYPEISLLDIGWLGYYPLMLAGLVLTYHRLRPERGWQGVLDAVCLAAAVALLAWIFVLEPVSGDADGGAVGVAVNLLYPAMALTGVVVVGWIVLRQGRQTPAWLVWVLAALVTGCVAEVGYLTVSVHGIDLPEVAYWLAFVASGWLWAIAAAVRLSHSSRAWSAGSESAPPAWSRAVPAVSALGAAGALLPGQGTVGLVAVAITAIAAGRLVATVRVNERLVAERDRLLVIDPLTGAHNRRFLDEELRRAHARTQRHGEPLAAIALDLDHFKEVNDDLGHGAGDEVLARTAAAMTAELRVGDLLFRLGGDEFLVLLPATRLREAREIAERLREAVRDAAAEVAPEGEVTASLGVSGIPALAAGAADLLSTADQALYLAKREGRDRVRVHRAPGVATGAAAA